MDGLQVLSVHVVAQDCGPHHVIETLSGEVGQIRHFLKAHVGKLPRRRRAGKIVIEYGRDNRVLTTEDISQVFRPQTAARTQFKDCFARKYMEAMPHGDSSPSQLERRGGRIPQPVSLPAALHLGEILFEFHKGQLVLDSLVFDTRENERRGSGSHSAKLRRCFKRSTAS